eukprot:TRINITY_DN67779_c0_g1_i1.p1 TRINITY_DN67779_c0_g1~~TRINITY_DN67779_c0_g1_i1.p1  ORF type:complete len:193 (+),score=37.87 TRINITY_DN67779_c0_g1_i1:2-580(+)
MSGLDDLAEHYFDVMRSQITPCKLNKHSRGLKHGAAVQFLELAVHYRVSKAISTAAGELARNPNTFQDDDLFEPEFIVEGETDSESVQGAFYKLSPEAASAVLAQDGVDTNGDHRCQEDEMVEFVDIWVRKNPSQLHKVCELLGSLRLELLSFSKLMALNEKVPSFEALGAARKQLGDAITEAMKANSNLWD